MDRAERLTHDFDITPEQGIEMNPLPQQAEEQEAASAETPEQEITDDSPIEDDASQSQTDESEENTEDEEQDSAGLNMSIGQFANAAGVTLQDMYGITMPDGRTLSQAVDQGKETQASIARLQTENRQLQEKLQETQNQYVPMDDPEALRLEKEAEVYQKQLDQADLTNMDPGQAANLRLNYMQTIQSLKTQAQEKRQENQMKQAQRANELLMASNTELLGKVPEWNSPDVYQRDNMAMAAFLRERGFSDNELFAIDRDPKAKLLVRDAWKALSKVSEINKGAKKVRKISKSLKPGSMTGGSRKRSLKDVGKDIRQGGTRAEKQRRRLTAEFDL